MSAGLDFAIDMLPGLREQVQFLYHFDAYIVTEWLPTSGYEYGNAPDIEVYLNPDPQNAQYEVWVPVIKG